ncbi:MAG: ABC transporter permease [Bacteroidales bacterium]|nr:ABC transporter permease [Bacteroidales bacterium]
MLLSLSWKNIWRKPSRSIVLIIAIAIGLTGGVFTIALADGMLEQRNQEVIDQQYSHIQIHNKEFYDNPKVKDSIPNTHELTLYLSEREDIQNFTSRLKFLGMANSTRSTQGVMICGIDPDDEMLVTTIHDCLIDTSSSYLTAQSTNQIVISTKIAQSLMLVTYELNQDDIDLLLLSKFKPELLDKLLPIIDVSTRSKNAFKDSLRKYLSSDEYENYAEVFTKQSTEYKLNKKIILRFNDINGNLIDEAFKIIGIYETNDAMFDNLNIFVNKNYIAQMLGVSANTATEIAIITTNVDNVKQTTSEIRAANENLLTESFIDLDPMSVWQNEFIGVFYNIIIAFILFALSFGIVNTVLMSVMERTKELGMVMSIGMKKSKVFLMIMFESIMVSLTGGFIGMALGAIITTYFSKHGIDISAYSNAMESFGYDSVMYPNLSFDFFINITILVILTGILSAIYPARRALKLNPSEALRSDA